MTEYCRLCAELKNSTDIVASIEGDERNIREKLLVCCQFNSEDTDCRLPQGVCLFCLDDLDKSWLFAQSVQLAQQRLLEIFEIDTKPLVAELVPNINQHSVVLTSGKRGPFECQLCVHKPFATHRSLQRHLIAHVNNSKGELKIDGVNEESRIIRTDGNGDPMPLGVKIYECTECNRIFDQRNYLNDHQLRCTRNRNRKTNDDSGAVQKQQQESDGLVEMESNIMDSKPSAVDLIEFEAEMRAGENPTIHDDDIDDGDGLDAIVEHSKNVKPGGRRRIRKRSAENGNTKLNKGTTPSVLHTIEKQGTFECQLCHKMFEKHSTLQSHLIAHVNKSKGKLKIIGAYNETRILRTNGDPIPLGAIVYECAECTRIFSRKNVLKVHLLRHMEKQSVDEYGPYVRHKGPFICRLCDKTHAKKQHLRRHLICHVLQSKGELQLEEIKGSQSSKPKFQIVRANGGGDPIYIPGTVTIAKCEECGKLCKDTSSLKAHKIAKHSNARPFECWLCHKKFKTKGATSRHLKTHVPDGFKRNSMCEQCGKAFKQALALSYHMQTAHNDERPFKCEICGLSFKLEVYLKAHLSTHYNKPQFKCAHCGKAFRTSHNWRNHLETHSGVVSKPFACDYCEMGFRSKCELMDHRSIHTGEKRFKCEHCASEFGARSSFYTHMRKVHGISLLALKKEKLKT